jgi:DNA-binding NarL/FixJ family response regulator
MVRTLGHPRPAVHTGCMPPPQVRVLVVDDQRPFRAIAAAVLRRMPDFTLVGEAETGEDGVRAAAELHPDLVLMDVRLPGIDGVVAAGRIHTATPDSVVVLCSSYAREDLPMRLDEPGVAGYLHKEELHGPALRGLWARLGH